MDRPGFYAGDGRPSPTRRELQGPRPSPLRVSKDSFKIKKPPIAPQLHHHHHHPPPPQQQQHDVSTQNRQTVVIYTVSPKVIHTTATDFMNLVQRLTGPSPRAAAESPVEAAGGRAGDVSPAARFASIEKASSSQSQRENYSTMDTHQTIMDILEETNAQRNQFPGILTPGPATLPPISPSGIFSPAAIDPFGLSSHMFLPSPSMFSSPLVSPNFSLDLYNAFFDF